MNTYIKTIRVRNMASPRGLACVPNQFIVHIEGEGKYFQSYSSVIAFIPYALSDHSKIVLDKEKWNYSNTTGKYRNIFLGEERKETEKKIKEGVYILADLNKI